MRGMVMGLAVAALVCAPASAKMVQQKVPYEIDGKKFQGMLVYDDSVKTKRPAILMAPDWSGVSGKSVQQAVHAAGKSYVIFVADMFGADYHPKSAKEMGAASGAIRKDIPMMRTRIEKGLDLLLDLGNKAGAIDANKVGAIGFCFGGGNVLELARTGANVKAVVTFHGDLAAEHPDASKVKSKILVLHGANDPVVPQKARNAFEDEMKAAKVSYEMVVFANTVHSFTDPTAKFKGTAEYNAPVARESYAMMRSFFRRNL
jgi:dienelactone hydrolase